MQFCRAGIERVDENDKIKALEVLYIVLLKQEKPGAHVCLL